MVHSPLTPLTSRISRATPQLCVALVCALLGVFALAAGPAAAASQFGSYGEKAGQFIEPNGIAVDQETGDIYVLDTNNERVERFTASGHFLLAWGWGVANGQTSALQTCTRTCFAGSHGTGAGQLGFAEGLAVDNDPHSSSHHDVYVVDLSNHRVEKFSPSGKFLLMFGGQVNESAHKRGEKANEGVCPFKPADKCTGGAAGIGRGQFEFPVEGDFIAVGPTGTVYVGDINRVEEFSPSGFYRSQVTLPKPQQTIGEPGGTIALAVDSSGNLYVVREGVKGVREYTPKGKLLHTFNAEGAPESNEGPTPAIAVAPSGQVFLDYHVEEQHRILEFASSGAELPSFDGGAEDGLHGIAYGQKTGKLYVVSVNNGANPTIAHVRVLTPPQLASPVFLSFAILIWPGF